MPGPYAESSIVIEIETGEPEEFLRIEPNGLPGDEWLHRLEEFDRSLDLEAVVDRYALPENDEYYVSRITVPAGEQLRIGDVAGSEDRTGGGNLVELVDRDSVPEPWIEETTTLRAFL